MLYVSISGIQLGFRGYISEQLLNNTAHVLISGSENNIESAPVTDSLYPGRKDPIGWVVHPSGKRDESKLENYQGWYQRLSQDPEVFDFSPRLTVNAILTNGKFTASVGLTGTLPERHVRITSIKNYMQEGLFTDIKGGAAKIILGSEVAKNLGAKVGQVIFVSTGNGNRQPFKLVGVLHFGNIQIDRTIAYAHLNHVQVLNRTPGRVSEIAVALMDMNRAPEVADLWQMLSRDKVQDWQEANRQFLEMIKVQDFVRYFVTSAILIVAGFGIYNILTIMISQKQKEIAILRSIGYGPGKILQMILYQGIILGFSGGALGILLGYLMCRWVETIDLGIKIGRSGGSMLVSYESSIYVTALVAANVAAVIASYLPARAASRMTPMDIIRAES